MKILYIANVRMPTERAYGLQIVKTCEALAEQGAEIELVIPSRRNSIRDDLFSYYGIKRNFDVTTLPVPDLVRFGPLGFLLSAVWFSEKVRWLRSFWTADAVYSRDALVLFQYLLLGRPLVFEAHAPPTLVSRIVACRARRVLVISESLRSAYVAAGVPSDRVAVAPDAVDEHLFDSAPSRAEARTALGLPSDENIVLYAGHLYARKGADTLAKAAAAVPGALFVFVGGTPDDVKNFKRVWGVSPNIRIVGQVKHELIPAYLRAADLLVLPNSGKDEDSARYTSPMKLFEYMASGTPIIASDVPAVHEILDTSMAVFVAPDNSIALGAGIERELRMPENGISRARRALAVIHNYTWRTRASVIANSLRTFVS